MADNANLTSNGSGGGTGNSSGGGQASVNGTSNHTNDSAGFNLLPSSSQPAEWGRDIHTTSDLATARIRSCSILSFPFRLVSLISSIESKSIVPLNGNGATYDDYVLCKRGLVNIMRSVDNAEAVRSQAQNRD